MASACRSAVCGRGKHAERVREGEARPLAEAAVARLAHEEDLADVGARLLRRGRRGGPHQGKAESVKAPFPVPQ